MEFQYKKKSEAIVMEKGDSPIRKWEDLDINIWVKILQSFELFQLIYVIPQVCRAWQLTYVINFLSELWSCCYCNRISSNPKEACVYVDRPSQEKLTRVLVLMQTAHHKTYNHKLKFIWQLLAISSMTCVGFYILGIVSDSRSFHRRIPCILLAFLFCSKKA